MNKYKNFSALAFCAYLLLSFSACNNKGEDQASKTEAKTAITKPETAQPTPVSTASVALVTPTLNPEQTAARETMQLAFQYSKEDPALAKLLADKRLIYISNQDALNKKIAELSPRGKELVEKEDSLLKNLLESSKAIREKKGVATEDLVKQQADTQKELTDVRKEKIELSKLAYANPELKTILQENAKSIKELDQQINKLVSEIKAKKAEVK